MITDFLNVLAHFIAPRGWKSTVLRRMWLIFIPVTGPIWLVLNLLTAILLLFIGLPLIAYEEIAGYFKKVWSEY